MEKMTSLLRLRMSAKDAHYGGNLVDGAHMVHLFGDVATELLIKCDGDEGLFCAYDNVEFLAPVYAGDYIEAYGETAACQTAFEEVRALCRLYERLFSRTLPHSDIARINSAHGQPVAIDPLTLSLIHI